MKRAFGFILTLVMVVGVLTSVPVSVNAASLDDLTFELNKDGKSYSLTKCYYAATEVEVPDMYKGLPVTVIGYGAFWGCHDLEKISIPHTIKKMEELAFEEVSTTEVHITDLSAWLNIDFAGISSNPLHSFDYGSSNLYLNNKKIVNLVIPDGITKIKKLAFVGCISIKNVTIPSSVKSIGVSSFAFCPNIESVSMAEGITLIDGYAFRLCQSLSSITIPDSVTSIGVCSFLYSGLTSLTIGDSVTSIGEEAFYGCKIDTLKLGKKISSIGDYAFCWNSELTDLSIPASVTSIGSGAFFGCENVRSVTNSKNVKTIKEYAFGYTGFSLNEPEKINDFTIRGIKGTAAETYAKENGFKFVEIKKPTKPTLKKVSNIDGNVKVTWGAVEGADLYRVYRMVSGGEYEYIGSTSNTSYTDKKAPAGKTCRYRIKAKNEAGYSEYSASIAIKHIDEPTLKSTENSAYGVLIKWGKVTGAKTYSVYRKVSGGAYEYLGATSNTYYTDKTAKSGTKYYYAIRGKNEESISSQSASLSKYYLADPTLKTPTSTTSGIKLSWSKVTGAEGYIVYRKTGSGSYEKLKTIEGVSKLSYTDTSAQKGKKYTYKIKAYKSKTYSAYSDAKSITDKY